VGGTEQDEVSKSLKDEGVENPGDVKLAYGVGNAGWLEFPNIEGVIVSEKFPWWITTTNRLRVKVKGIWLVSSEFANLSRSFVAGLGIPVYELATMKKDEGRKQLQRELEGVRTVMLDGNCPRWIVKEVLDTREMEEVLSWGMKAITEGARADWKVQHVGLTHHKAGGITDGEFILHVARRSGASWEGFKRQPRRKGESIGSVTKLGISGRFMKIVEKQERGDNKDSGKSLVHWAIPGTVLASTSLLPYGKGPKFWPKVRTKFGGEWWVDRFLTDREKFAVLDVPEKLVDMATDLNQAQALLEHVVPIKILQTGSQVLRPAESTKTFGKGLKNENKKDACVSNANLVVETVLEEGDDVTNGATVKPEIADKAGDFGAKAVKHDKAPVHHDMWNRKTIEGLSNFDNTREWKEDFDKVRSWLLVRWKRRLWTGFRRWANEETKGRTGVASLDEKWREAARDALRRGCDTTWWEWKSGSRPFYWNWPEDIQDTIAHGLKLWLKGTLEPWTRAQKRTKNKENCEKVMAKLLDIQKKGYIEPGVIESLISYFDVPKGESDIRMVYDGTASGLNDVLFAPWFPLPTVNTMLRSMEPGYFMSDNDVGEMFLNFILHEDVRRLCGIDLTPYFEKEAKAAGVSKVWERWNRCAMGLRTSPYQAVQAIMRAHEVIIGNRHSASNVFRWEHVRLNLPGSSDYDPSKPWVCKIRSDGKVAADLHIYVDDLRITAPTEEDCWVASQRVSSILASLGIQDAARKRRYPSWTPGAWAGSVTSTSDEDVFVTVSQEKWDKTKTIVEWIRDRVECDSKLNYKMLESYRGFLIYVTRTFPAMVPYLKGIHATLNMWRGGRDDDGWKLKAEDLSDWLEDFDAEKMGMVGQEWEHMEKSPPKEVHAVPRLKTDIAALVELTRSQKPPLRMARLRKEARVVYGFGDASGPGYGSSIEINRVIRWRRGHWHHTISKESSNYRELRNLVEALEETHQDGHLAECEVFMFTDNSVAERAFFRGTSTSQHLHELVLRLRKLEMTGNCRIYLIHVSGKRMVWQGTDGLSRDDFNAGVMMGEEMKDFIPIHLSAFDRSCELKDWIGSWAVDKDGLKGTFMTPDDWPQGHERGTYVWSPPPSAAPTAIEWMAGSIHKRPFSTHIVIVPRLMTAWWFRIVSKSCDVIFPIPATCDVWSTNQFEPLLVAIYLPLSRDSPWRHKGTPLVDRLRGSLSGVWTGSVERQGSLLRQLLVEAWKLAGV
jgi:hypothetical protein